MHGSDFLRHVGIATHLRGLCGRLYAAQIDGWGALRLLLLLRGRSRFVLLLRII